MDPDKKQLIIMLGIVGVLLIVAGLMIFWPSNLPPPQSSPSTGEGGIFSPPPSGGETKRGGEGELSGASNSPQPSLSLREGEVVSPPTPDQQDAAGMLALARSFAELFGTYSSEAASFSTVNLADLATPSFQKWFAGAWPKLRATFFKDGYYSMTTRALGTKTISHDPVAGKASVEVQVQQEEVSGGGGATSISYRTLQLELLRQDGNWLVERASWR